MKFKGSETMNLVEEYKLSQYQEFGILNNNENVRLVRNSITGKIAVKKTVRPEQKIIYEFLQSHENSYIPCIYECMEYNNQCIVIEEYIEGRTLSDILKEKNLSEQESGRIVQSLCRALHPLHTAYPPIICRDIKPENIMIDSTGRVRLIDFDIARMVQPYKNRDTVVLGTEGYASPEQFGHLQTDPRSDIYSLGILLNYLVLGKLPVEEIASGELGKVVRKCIAMNPLERYQSVKELEADLELLYPVKKNGELEFNADAEYPNEKNNWRKYIPPGFRSGSVPKMIFACVGYLMIFWFSFSLKFCGTDRVIEGALLWSERMMFLIAQILEVGIIFDYLGWQEKIPFLRTENRFIKIVGYVVCWFLLLFFAAIICVILEEIL